jgi:hypothetical protein
MKNYSKSSFMQLLLFLQKNILKLGERTSTLIKLRNKYLVQRQITTEVFHRPHSKSLTITDSVVAAIISILLRIGGCYCHKENKRVAQKTSSERWEVTHFSVEHWYS